MICSSASGKAFVNCQLIEVVRCVNTMLIHLQLVANHVYSLLAWMEHNNLTFEMINTLSVLFTLAPVQQT